MVQLPKTSPWTAKDQAKSDRAYCFIGRGSPRSSTNAYAKAWGERANKGAYTSGDIVFVSTEGMRNGRLPPDLEELRLAIDAGATFITDTPYHRNRHYNVGEREVAYFLEAHGYQEAQPGVWTPKA